MSGSTASSLVPGGSTRQVPTGTSTRARLPGGVPISTPSWAASMAGLASAAFTTGCFLLGHRAAPLWTFTEILLLCVLVGLSARWARPRAAVVSGVVAGLPAAVAVLRTGTGPASAEIVYGVAFWALAPIGFAVVGVHFRAQEARRARLVESTRQAQRLALAGDLHDYVAHDVSEMIARAQAGQLAADPATRALLRRIEQAGLTAMACLDQTVHMLHSDRDLTSVVARFADASTADVRLSIEPGVPRPPAVQRIVVEALTNVRRHAPAAAAVAITLRAVGNAVEVTVTDSGGGRPDPSRHSGFGLSALRDRVTAAGGTFHAGPHGDGWQVLARLPVPS